MPQPQVVYQQPPDATENWYLRGFVGVGMNGTYTLDYLPAPANVGNGFALEHHSIADTTFVGGGFGYEWNSWLRLDFTGEYRSRTRVYAFGSYPPNGLDTYEGHLKNWVFLANAFVDLGTWNCFTPFVGFGVGGAHLSLVDFTDINPNGGRGFGRNPSQWNLAWAVYAGVGYAVNKNLKIDFTYRYLDFGSITDTIDCVGGCNADSYKFDKLFSHDFMLGLRWTCCDTPPAPPPPRYVYSPPPQVYTPPPVYAPPPPLRSKG
jgi:opacity protein-like surface antigen